MPARPDSAAAARLRAAADRFTNHVGHWESPRWSGPAADGLSRAGHMHALVQELADLCADAERGPRRPVPRLDNDLALVDQLRVTVRDLLCLDPPASPLDAATEAIAAVDLG